MSLSKFDRSWRGRLSFAASILLLTGALVMAPQASSARNAVKQFTATIVNGAATTWPPSSPPPPATAAGQQGGTWTEAVTNCGSTTPRCTQPSAIALGTIQIVVPTEFQPITSGSVTAISPTGQTTRNWTVSYTPASGSTPASINGHANQGTDKLMPGESILIQFSATPSCTTGTKTFTTSAWGSTPLPGTDPFQIVGSQPTITISGCVLGPGDSLTGPKGTTITAGEDFTGTVSVTFGGDLDCSTFPSGPGHGDGIQWSTYQLPDEVNVDSSGVESFTNWKSYTFTFDATGFDSSWYLICYGSIHEWTGEQGTQTVDGESLHTGILSRCSYYDPDTGTSVALAAGVPCVSDQHLSLDGGTISITVRDPLATKFH